MIFNRTYADIINAKNIYINKIQKAIALTQDEQATIDKAFFNLKTVKRIADTMREVCAQIWQLSGNKVDLRIDECEKNWTNTDYYLGVNHQHILDNLRLMRDSVKELEDSGILKTHYQEKIAEAVKNSHYDYSWQTLNAIEEALYWMLEAVTTWAIQEGDTLYIYTANEVIQEGEVLTIK